MFFKKEENAPLSISGIEDYPSIRIVRLCGPIDQTAVAELERFRKWVERHKGFKHKHVLLDFKKVTHMDTSAVAEILQAVAELRTANYRFGVLNLSEKFRDMLRMLKVDKWIVFYNNESEALNDLTKNINKQE